MKRNSSIYYLHIAIMYCLSIISIHVNVKNILKIHNALCWFKMLNIQKILVCGRSYIIYKVFIINLNVYRESDEKKKWDRWSIKPDLFSLISVTRPRKIVFDKWASDRWRITTYMHQLINEHFFIYQILRPTNHNLIDHDNKTLRPIGLIMLDIRSCLLQWLIIIYRLLTI